MKLEHSENEKSVIYVSPIFSRNLSRKFAEPNFPAFARPQEHAGTPHSAAHFRRCGHPGRCERQLRGHGVRATAELVNRPLSDRLGWGQSLAAGAASQTNVDLVAASAPGAISANSITTSLQPEFAQRDAVLLRVDAPRRLGLVVDLILPSPPDVLDTIANRGPGSGCAGSEAESNRSMIQFGSERFRPKANG